MTFRDAVRSLRSDKSRTFFYWITYFLTSMFIFLFFNIMMSDPKGMKLITSGEDLVATFIVVVVVVICLMCISFANNFYVRSKGKDIAVRMICGATFTKVTAYLFVQILIIMICSIPLGILTGYILMPVLNSLIASFTSSSLVIGVHSEANTLVYILLGMIVIWSMAVNLSFTYTNAAFSMMTNDGSYSTKEGGTFGGLLSSIPPVFKQIFYLALFLIPLFAMFNPNVSKMTVSLMGLIGVWGIMNYIIIPRITKSMDKTNVNKPLILAGNGFLRKDLMINKGSIILFIRCAVVQISIIAERQDQIFDSMLFSFSYVLMNFLLAMMIMFKSSTEQTGRRKYFEVLYQIGFEEKDLKKVINTEVIKLYGMVAGITLIYIGVMMTAIMKDGGLSPQMMVLLIAELLIPILLCMVVNIFTYRRAVLTDLSKPR